MNHPTRNSKTSKLEVRNHKVSPKKTQIKVSNHDISHDRRKIEVNCASLEPKKAPTVDDGSKAKCRSVQEEKDAEPIDKNSILYMATHNTAPTTTKTVDINSVLSQAVKKKSQKEVHFLDIEQPSNGRKPKIEVNMHRLNQKDVKGIEDVSYADLESSKEEETTTTAPPVATRCTVPHPSTTEVVTRCTVLPPSATGCSLVHSRTSTVKTGDAHGTAVTKSQSSTRKKEAPTTTTARQQVLTTDDSVDIRPSSSTTVGPKYGR